MTTSFSEPATTKPFRVSNLHSESGFFAGMIGGVFVWLTIPFVLSLLRIENIRFHGGGEEGGDSDD